MTVQTDHLDWSLPAHRRGTSRGMDAATRTYSRRVPRWWAARALQPNLGFATDRMRRNPDAASCLLVTAHTDHLDWSLPAHRRGTLRGMDAA
ncbi:hypothetical protein XarbCFBP6827_12385 [Xanthomonas arboricola]|nr:hypothetical protein XarbCFBP6827_12385 [Xanthomonas arboricola]